MRGGRTRCKTPFCISPPHLAFHVPVSRNCKSTSTIDTSILPFGQLQLQRSSPCSQPRIYRKRYGKDSTDTTEKRKMRVVDSERVGGRPGVYENAPEKENEKCGPGYAEEDVDGSG
jgi:hypothetical protein